LTIDRLIELTDAIKLNETEIDEVYSATVYAKKVTDGDLFIGSDISEIDEAIQNGASTILTDSDIQKDVQVLKVEDIQNATLKIASYIAYNDQDLYFYLLNPHALSFIKMIMLDKKNIEYIPDDYKRAFEMVLNSNKPIFLSDNEELLKKIKPKIKKYKKSAHGYNIEDTLFRSTFRAGKYVYQHKQMAPFHISFLLEAVALCEEHNLAYDIDRVCYTKHFKPIFIEEETGIQAAHKNDHVVILCDNIEDIQEGRDYAKLAKVVMSKSIVFTKPKVRIEGYAYPTIYRDTDSLVQVVKTTSFHYGFILSEDKKDYQALKEYFEKLNEDKVI
jgi:hypothetical protein